MQFNLDDEAKLAIRVLMANLAKAQTALAPMISGIDAAIDVFSRVLETAVLDEAAFEKAAQFMKAAGELDFDELAKSTTFVCAVLERKFVQ